jgi:hypothetical protein
VPHADPDRGSGPYRRPDRPLTFYVEGPRDRSILRAWAYRLMPSRARALFHASVILGGRRPARALAHFRAHLDEVPGTRAICVLDRDGGGGPLPDPNGYDLRFFTWSRRHIESYLMVPAAIRRALDLPEGDRRVERALDPRSPGTSAPGGLSTPRSCWPGRGPCPERWDVRCTWRASPAPRARRSCTRTCTRCSMPCATCWSGPRSAGGCPRARCRRR